MPAGVAAFHESVPQVAAEFDAGLLSFIEETNVPEGGNPVCMKISKPVSVVTPPVVGIDQTVPLVAPVILVPPG